MLSAEIIAIGSELLTPDKTDTNSLWLTRELNDIGIEVMLKTVVGDEMLFSGDVMRSRSKELKSRDRTERRSSSLGANLKQQNNRKTNEQQPQRPTTSTQAANSSPSTHREFFPSSEKTEQTGAGMYKLKKMIGHKR